jgi:hypothetical protein
MKSIMKSWLKRFRLFCRIRLELMMEILALHHQVAVYERSGCRPHFYPIDRLFWVSLSRFWPGWENALEIIQPDTVKRWRRQGIRVIFSRRPRRNLGGRPPIRKEIRDLIKRMARNNFLWGAPRIYGELLKLGYKGKVSQASVSRYLKRYFPKPRYLTWRVFIKNQLIGLEGFHPTTTITRPVNCLLDILSAWWKQSWLDIRHLMAIPPPTKGRKHVKQAGLFDCQSNLVEQSDQFPENIICQRILVIPIRGSPSDKIATINCFSDSMPLHLLRVEHSRFVSIRPTQYPSTVSTLVFSIMQPFFVAQPIS